MIRRKCENFSASLLIKRTWDKLTRYWHELTKRVTKKGIKIFSKKKKLNKKQKIIKWPIIRRHLSNHFSVWNPIRSDQTQIRALTIKYIKQWLDKISPSERLWNYIIFLRNQIVFGGVNLPTFILARNKVENNETSRENISSEKKGFKTKLMIWYKNKSVCGASKKKKKERRREKNQKHEGDGKKVIDCVFFVRILIRLLTQNSSSQLCRFFFVE